METMDLKKAYNAPKAKAIDLNIQDVLCLSQDNGAVSIDNYKEDTLDW